VGQVAGQVVMARSPLALPSPRAVLLWATRLLAVPATLAGIDRHRPLTTKALVAEHLPEINFRSKRALQERRPTRSTSSQPSAAALSPMSYWWDTTDIV
jgi:hypothetical protein